MTSDRIMIRIYNRIFSDNRRALDNVLHRDIKWPALDATQTTLYNSIDIPTRVDVMNSINRIALWADLDYELSTQNETDA